MSIEGVGQVPAVKNVQAVGRELANNSINTKQYKEMPNQQQNLEQRKLSEKEIINSIEKANRVFEIHDKRVEFSIHEKTKAIMIKIIDSKTDEVIKEIPPEKILDMVAKMMELAGILVDEKA